MSSCKCLKWIDLVVIIFFFRDVILKVIVSLVIKFKNIGLFLVLSFSIDDWFYKEI